MDELRLVVYGVPQPQERPRSCMMHGKHGQTYARMYSPKSDWSKAVTDLAALERPPKPWDGPVGLEILYVFPRLSTTRKHDKYKFTKPDIDNLDVAVLNCLKKAGWFFDDSRVVRLLSEKPIGQPNEKPRTEITAKLLEDHYAKRKETAVGTT